jgi:methanogenic corrinoid protein MtbC1
VNPAQEHLVTNIIRQKLIVGIESCISHAQTCKVAILFLPEGEHHELGLLFMYYLLKNRGIKVYYLGTNVPMRDVDYIVRLKKPDFVYSHLTSVAHNFNFDKFLTNLHNRMPDMPAIVSGLLTQNYKKRVPSNVSFKKSLQDVMEYIAELVK